MDKQMILLVEDDNTLRMLYDTLLRKHGYTVDTAADGIAGFKKAQSGGYKLVILDVMLPLMDGLSILSSLKSNPPELPNGPIIVMSNLANDKICHQAKTCGAVDYIVKSETTPIEVVERVKKILEGR
jgi:DNA-binding response OmpR family regulator